MIEHLQALAIHAYYAGEIETGRRACERLLSMPLPPEVEMQTRRNRTWYSERLDDLVPARYHRIDVEPAHEGWSLFNPTLLVHRGELVGLVRSSNYKIRDGVYEPCDETDRGTIRTDNLLVRYGSDLTVASCRAVRGPEYETTEYPVFGLEDCRLRHTKTGIGVSATVRNAAPFDGRCRIGVADLDIDTGEATRLRVLDGLSAAEHEKNWMPIEDGPLHGGWVYACYHNGHAVAVAADPTLGGAYQLLQHAAAPHLAKEFRGGGQLIWWRGGYLGVIHEVAVPENGQRVYEHRFVWFDASLALRRVSMPFVFREQRAIEFAAGLAAIGDRVVVSFGVRDAEAWLVELAGDDVKGLLRESCDHIQR
jgi:hypothetical protein